MNAKVHPFTNHQSARTPLRPLLAALAGALALVAGGCSSPVEGPTDPKEFIVQRRNWTTGESAPTRPDSAAPAVATPVPADAPTAAPAPGKL